MAIYLYNNFKYPSFPYVLKLTQLFAIFFSKVILDTTTSKGTFRWLGTGVLMIIYGRKGSKWSRLWQSEHKI